MTVAQRILAAIKDGHITAPVIARQLDISRNHVSVVLQKMHDRGSVKRGRTVYAGPGRPPVQWSIVDTTALRAAFQ